MNQEADRALPEWAEPGVFEVVPGIHRMPLPLPMDALRAVNVYVLETESGLTLIDGGWAIPQARDLFDAGLKQLGYAAADITNFYVTHVHRDHYTLAYLVGKETGAKVHLGLGDKETLDIINRDDVTRDPNVTRLELAGAHPAIAAWRQMMPTKKPDNYDYGYPDVWLQDDFEIALPGRKLAAVATPGHTQGHYVFAEQAAGVLFAGDHVLPTITPSVGFEPAWVEQPLIDFMNSLAKVQALPDLQLLPAHGPVTSSSHQRVAELLAHHEERLAQSLTAVAGGCSTAWEVAAELPWTKRNRTRDELGPFDVVLAAFETMAHLEMLVAQGKLSKTKVDTELHFSVKN